MASGRFCRPSTGQRARSFSLFQWTPRLAARWPPAEKPQTAILAGSTPYSSACSLICTTLAESSHNGVKPVAGRSISFPVVL